MGKEEKIEVEGIVIEPLPSTTFRIKLIGEGYEGQEITGHLSGKMKLHFIRILPGDKVTVQLSTYNLSQGIITYRHK